MSLLFFSSPDCERCARMRVLVAKLNFEIGAEVIELDVIRNIEALDQYESLRTPDCDGLPYFWNTETGVPLCGEVSYKLFRAWAMGGNVVQ